MPFVDATVVKCLRQRLSTMLMVATTWCFVGITSPAAEPEFVGVLALAIEDQVAEVIGLTASQRDQLLELVDQREIAVLEVALQVRDLPEAERLEKLAPFRAESERLGLQILNAQQRGALRAVQLGRQGMQSLGAPEVAAKLGLSEQQRTDLKRLLEERDAATRNADRRTALRLRENYERQLKEVLTQEQVTRWNKIVDPAARDGNQPGDTAPQADAQLTAAEPTLGETIGAGPADGALVFNFRYAPWSTVLDWFASQANLSLVMDAPPQGTFNYTDARSYTPAEAIDLINSVLLTKGYTLIRRERMLMLINLKDGIPPNLVTQVPVEELEQRGEYELVRCLFSIRSMKAEDAAKEIDELVGPQGAIVVLPTARQLLVTETAGRLRTIREVLEAGDRRDKERTGNAKLLPLRHVKAADILTPWRQLMGLAEEDNSTTDGSLRIAAGPSGKRLLVTGRADLVRQFSDLVTLIDVPLGGGFGSALDALQLEVYSVTDADPNSVLEVMQTLFAGLDDVRLASDPKTGDLVALARPSQHATIQATIDQMQRDRRQLEVIRLNIVDPQLAMMSIDKLFGTGSGDAASDPNAPRVDAEPTTRSLLIRGSQAQISEIRELLAKMGETEAAREMDLATSRGNVRMLPIAGARARRVLQQIDAIWPSIRKNRIHVVNPASTIRAVQPARDASPLEEAPPKLEQPDADPQAEPHDSHGEARLPGKHRSAETVLSEVPTPLGLVTMIADPPLESARPPAETNETLADIVVTPGHRGILIASDDLEALNEFERLARTLADRLFTGSRELVIYYLKYAKAEVAKELVGQLLGAGGGDEGGGGSLLGSLAGAALGESGGGLVGSLLGLGGGDSGGGSVALTSNVTIIADTRLNALLIQATPEELDLAEQLLKVLDVDNSPEQLQTSPRPRTIPVLNTNAEDIAAIVRNVYATRMSGKGGGAREPSPEEIIRAMSGQRDRRKSMQDAVADQVRMTVNVDSRRNALIVMAPESLFLEVKALVEQLDTEVPAQFRETVRVVSIKRTSPETIRRALAAIAGDNLRTSGVPAKPSEKAAAPITTDETNRTQAGPGRQPSDEQAREQFRQRMQFLNMLQRAGQQGNKPSDRGRSLERARKSR